MRVRAPAASRDETRSAIAPPVSRLEVLVLKPHPVAPTDPTVGAERIGHSLWDVDVVPALEGTAETAQPKSPALAFRVCPASSRNRRPDGSVPHSSAGRSPRHASGQRTNRYTAPRGSPVCRVGVP